MENFDSVSQDEIRKLKESYDKAEIDISTVYHVLLGKGLTEDAARTLTETIDMELLAEHFSRDPFYVRVAEKTIEIVRPGQTFGREHSIGVDHRTMGSKFSLIIQYLRELDFKEGDNIPFKDVAYVLSQILGFHDKRTIKAYLSEMVEFGYLKKASKIPERRVCPVTMRNPQTGTLRIREFSSPIGVKAYSFGVRAPRSHQETLNPKYVTPKR